jgi:hypothetical protein
MQKCLGAACGLAFLGLLLVGPAYLAVSNAATAPTAASRCSAADLACDPRAQTPDLR